MTIDTMLVEFPRLQREDIFESLSFASQRMQDQYLPLQTAWTMQFLIDENLACSCVKAMQELGYVAVHVSEVGLSGTDDTEIVT